MNARTPAIPETETRASGPAKPRRSRIRRVLPLAALLALAGGAVGGSWYWTVGRFMESTDNAYVGGDIAVLSSRIEGDVERILVTDNQAVEAGQPLIELDRRSLTIPDPERLRDVAGFESRYLHLDRTEHRDGEVSTRASDLVERASGGLLSDAAEALTSRFKGR